MEVGNKHIRKERPLSVLLQSLGDKLAQPLAGRRGGAGPAEGITLMVQGRPLTVPTRGSFIVFEVGLPGILAGALLASTFFFFILSVTRNTVANTLVLMSVGPFFVALSDRIFLGEQVSLRTWGTISAALVGIVLMFAEGLDSGRTIGNLLALGVPVAFGLNVVILRRTHASVSMAPMVMLAGIFSIIVSCPLAWPFTPTLRDFVVLGIMGWLQLGIGCVLMVLAARYLSAAEIGLFSLLETILGPIFHLRSTAGFRVRSCVPPDGPAPRMRIPK